MKMAGMLNKFYFCSESVYSLSKMSSETFYKVTRNGGAF